MKTLLSMIVGLAWSSAVLRLLGENAQFEAVCHFIIFISAITRFWQGNIVYLSVASEPATAGSGALPTGFWRTAELYMMALQLFIFFWLAHGIGNVLPFLTALIVLNLSDILWFWRVYRTTREGSAPRDCARSWILLNAIPGILTAAVLLLLGFSVWPARHSGAISALYLVGYAVVAVLDYATNSEFYFSPEAVRSFREF